MHLAPLDGFTIAVTADRRADEQMQLLAGRGADCLHGPVIKTHPVQADHELRSVSEALIADPPEVVVLTTGLGTRSWLEAADSMQLDEALHDLLASAELCARGPKARGALVTAGLEVAWTAPNARYDDIIDMLAERDVAGVRIAVQLDGAGEGDLCRRIAAMGAVVIPIPIYRWSLPADVAPAERVVRAVLERRVDAVTFTARPAVENFLEIAEAMGCTSALHDVLGASVAAFCVGPVCALGLTDAGFGAPAIPQRHRLGAMVQQIALHFADRGRDEVLAGHRVRVQGRLAVLEGGESVRLTDRERAVLDVLLERPGVVHSKRELLAQVWQGAETDEHLVEVTVARLRQRLGPAADGIETVIRRGYRAAAG